MAYMTLHYNRSVGQHDVKDVFEITKSIQMTRTELGMQVLLEPLVAQMTGNLINSKII